jgi:uncharacterized membrane protein
MTEGSGAKRSAAGCGPLMIAGFVLALVATQPGIRDPLLRLLPWRGAALPVGGAAAQPPAADSVAEELRALEDAVREARQEALLLHETRIAARQERMAALASGFETARGREYRRIRLRNACRYVVAVCLSYEDLDGAPISRGWWEVPAGGEVTTNAMTRGREFFLYAENQKVGRTWDGQGVEGARTLTITDAKFDHLEGEAFLYGQPRSVPFAPRRTGEAWLDHTEVFECPAEAPPTRRPAVEATPRPRTEPR